MNRSGVRFASRAQALKLQRSRRGQGEQGWLPERCEEMDDVIQFDDLVDTGDEYEELEAVAEDRANALSRTRPGPATRC